MDRVIAYVDGFNLYFGLKDSGWKRYYWLNVQALALSLLTPNQQLVATKYFTARVSATKHDPDKPRRQNTYLEALETLADLRILYGSYLPKYIDCNNCGRGWNTFSEKGTDVNIAVEILADGVENKMDVALLISADSDLCGANRAFRRI